MRNLKLLHSNCVANIPQLDGAQCIDVDYDTGHVYVATATEILVLDAKAHEVLQSVNLSEDGKSCGRVVGIQHLPDQMSVCVGTAQGDVLLCNTTTGELECVGTVPELCAMQWSPDQELLLLVTGQSTLIMMTRDFDPVSEVPLHPSEFGEAELITVGWGKKETQFHGSEGKAAAKQKAQAARPAFSWDDKQPRISWRGDGQNFAISSINPQTGARQIRVWNRDCSLHSTSEEMDGLEQSVAWKPSGSLIASSQRRPNKHEIAFFEKNGLRHGEFTLPFGVNDVKVREVLWNTESTVLCVWCEDLPPEGSTDFLPKSYVQLWTVGNYHWYLKQSLNFPATTGDRVAAIVWDPEHAYSLHMICHGGKYLRYTWHWATSVSLGQIEEDLTNVAVVDGDKLLMTPFRTMVVPPPMSAYSLQMSCPIHQVALSCQKGVNQMAVVTADDNVAIYSFDTGSNSDKSIKICATGENGFVTKCKPPKLQQTFLLKSLSEQQWYPLSCTNFTWVSATTLLFTRLGTSRGQSVLCKAELCPQDNTASVSTETELEGVVLNIAVNPETGSVVIQLTDATLLKYDTDSGVVMPWEDSAGREVRLPQACGQLALCRLAGEEAVLGLTERYRFYANDTEVASNCTSFAIHEEFLLLTTHSHTCRCISRETKISALPSLSDGKAHPFDESIRRLERGSRIVCVVPDDTKLVLQMPRGNLEAIHPRALVLSAVRKHLDHLQFKAAFTAMRRHRINMNLLYDHSPSNFLDNIRTFIAQIDDVTHINLFLTDLHEADVTRTMYTAAYHRPELSENDLDKRPCKIDTVCDALRQALEKVDPDRFLLSILTAHVKKVTPELETTLFKVRALKGAPPGDQKVSAEAALKYLLFLVDVNKLYDVALGTYDFGLVLMVAEKSQKDPKEYLPFLNQLRQLEPNYQKYTIDKHLKRYESALENISKCGMERFNECVDLVKEHKLYSKALTLFAVGTEQYKMLSSEYGSYLSDKKHHEEAALVYMKGGHHQMALECCEACCNWRQAVVMATRLEYAPDKMTELCRKLAEKLKEERRHAEAACLFEQYANDMEEAIVTLIEGGEWEEALRLMYKYNRVDFMETNLKPTLVETFDHQMELLSSIRADFERYKTRLVVVREKKERAGLDFLEGGGDHNLADADLFSDTSSATGESMISGSSRYSASSQRSSLHSRASGSSQKSRRKAQRKKWSLREGHQHEDVALVEALSKLITQTDNMKGEIHSCLKMLYLLHYEKQASELQNQYQNLLTYTEKYIPQIWDPKLDYNSLATTASLTGPESTANTIAQAMRQGQTAVTTESSVYSEPFMRMAPVRNKDVKWSLDVTTGGSTSGGQR